MKKLIFILLFLVNYFLSAQTNTEVHVFDIIKSENGFELKNSKNISNNVGYDNQPSFYSKDQILFAYKKDKFTDILFYDLKNDEKKFISFTPKGGEYSPQRIPQSNDVTAVRLDDNGYQRLYRYNFRNGSFKELIKDLKVAYPMWYSEDILIASVIVNDNLELFICDIKSNEFISVAKNVGRSVHKIPNSDLVSFISKENDKYWLLKSLNIKTKEIKTITSVGKSEDCTWLPNGTLLLPNQSTIYQFNPKKDKQPKLFYSFSDENINNISRMTVNTDGTKLAIVAEASPRYLAEEQLNGYNSRDIDAFLKPFHKNVKVFNFPNELRYEGIDNMRKGYASFFKNTPDLHCKILKRIVHKDKVIDHELVTANGRQFNAVAIYTMKNGKIVTVTFM